MALIPYALTRPFLFGMDPEAAHELTLGQMARLQNTLMEQRFAAGYALSLPSAAVGHLTPVLS